MVGINLLSLLERRNLGAVDDIDQASLCLAELQATVAIDGEIAQRMCRCRAGRQRRNDYCNAQKGREDLKKPVRHVFSTLRLSDTTQSDLANHDRHGFNRLCYSRRVLIRKATEIDDWDYLFGMCGLRARRLLYF